MAYKVLVINPGSTSTKIAVYEDDKQLFQKNVEHDAAKIGEFPNIPSQAPYRTEYIDKALAEEGIDQSTIDIIMCRGGLVMKPAISSGAYIVNDDLYKALGDEELTSPHGSLLGGLIGKQFADKLGIKAYIYDAVTSGNLPEIARISGYTEFGRSSTAHVLNGRSQALKYATAQGKKLEDMNIVVCHMGGGCSVMAFRHGELVDTLGDDEFHMSAERAGGAQLMHFIKAFLDGKHTKDDVKKLLRGKGYGFGDNPATENMVFYEGRGHKLNNISFNIPQKEGVFVTRGSCCGTQSGDKINTGEMHDDFMKPWTFTSDDGRFEMDFVPVLDRAADTDVKIIRSNQHQVFGYYTGNVILDDGTKLHIDHLLGFAEKVFNKW